MEIKEEYCRKSNSKIERGKFGAQKQIWNYLKGKRQ